MISWLFLLLLGDQNVASARTDLYTQEPLFGCVAVVCFVIAVDTFMVVWFCPVFLLLSGSEIFRSRSQSIVVHSQRS